MFKRRKILLTLLSFIFLLGFTAAAYAYYNYATALAQNITPLTVITTQVPDFEMTSIAPSTESAMLPGWVSYQGIDISAPSGNETQMIHNLTLNITGGSNILHDIEISICKKENQNTAISSSEFTYTQGSLAYNTNQVPIQHYISGGVVALPSSDCTSVVSEVTLDTLGSSYRISSNSPKTMASGKHDKYYIILKYLNRDSAQVQGETFTITPTLSPEEYTPDPSGANEPKLVTNLIPVVYDESISKWRMSATASGVWYDYSEQKWANAVTVTSAKRGTYNVGDTIEMEDILGMWVWIPRYEYKYTNLGTSYAGGTASLPGGIDINFISGTSTTETSGYIIHPAFRDASSGYTNNAGTFSAYQIGGWDSELTGFWMGKFETASLALASTGNQSSSENITDSDPIVKPNVIARRYQAIYYQYSTAQNIGTYHGISTLDTHMGKNSEWGAVAYLSQSAYGKYGNSDYSGANKEVYLNNSSNYYTGRSMGMPSGASGYTTSTSGTYEYNEAQNGTGASTTGNIYGIYDMAGGAWEYVMGWRSTASSNFGYFNDSGTDTNGAGFSSAPSSHKYWDEYTTGVATTACGGICYGHGLSETAGWYGDYREMASDGWPWFGRGSCYSGSHSVTEGIFFYDDRAGESNHNRGGRAVLV